MSDPLIARTEKSEVTRIAADAVRKRYLTEDGRARATREVRALRFLEERFGTVSFDGWTYAVTRLVREEQEGPALVLEYASGSIIADLPAAAAGEAAFHAGVWLGLYQQRVMGGEDAGLPYTDCTLYNMAVDFGARTVTVFDPGNNWGRTGWIYEDVVLYLISVLSVSMRRRVAPFRQIHRFLKGYASVPGRQFRLRSYYRGAASQLLRKDRDLGKGQGLLRQWTLRLGTLLFSPVFFLYLPLYLQVKHRRMRREQTE